MFPVFQFQDKVGHGFGSCSQATVLLSEMAQHTAMPDVISYTAATRTCIMGVQTASET